MPVDDCAMEPEAVDVEELRASLRKARAELEAAAAREAGLRTALSSAQYQARHLETERDDAVRRHDAAAERNEGLAARLEASRGAEETIRKQLSAAKRGEGEAKAALIREELARQSLEARLSDGVPDAGEPAATRVGELEAQLAAMTVERNSLQEQLDGADDVAAHRQRADVQAREATESLRRSLADAEARITTLLEEGDKRTMENARLRAELLEANWQREDETEIVTEVQDLRDKVASLETDIEECHRHIRVLEAEREKQESTIAELRGAAARKQTAEYGRVQDDAQLATDLAVAQTVIETLQQQCDDSEKWIASYRTRVAELNEKNGHLSRQLASVLRRLGARTAADSATEDDLRASA